MGECGGTSLLHQNNRCGLRDLQLAEVVGHILSRILRISTYLEP